ncbi:unnamed protein product, partial [Laminaria digitata]
RLVKLFRAWWRSVYSCQTRVLVLVLLTVVLATPAFSFFIVVERLGFGSSKRGSVGGGSRLRCPELVYGQCFCQAAEAYRTAPSHGLTRNAPTTQPNNQHHGGRRNNDKT